VGELVAVAVVSHITLVMVLVVLAVEALPLLVTRAQLLMQ
jgi:hypothetical protein